MTFESKIKDLSIRASHAIQKAVTEEATKTSVILPFIKALEFDPFDLDEVIPEYIADVGTKKGEKVDFAIKVGGKTTILIEAKPITMSLGNAQFNQLYRYFGVTDAKLAILTNGQNYWFFSDIDEANKLDKKPFFKFDLSDYSDDDVVELARFKKSAFDIDTILDAASALKYSTKAANYISQQLTEPDDEFIKLIGKNIHDGMLTKSVVAQIKPAIQSALDQVVKQQIQNKLGIAFSTSQTAVQEAQSQNAEDKDIEDSDDGINTTEDEIQAFLIIRAIVAKVIGINRVTMRDARSYCSVFIDDNNRKPLCRLYFNSKSKVRIGVFSPDKSEEKHEISSLEDIFLYSDQLERTAKSYI